MLLILLSPAILAGAGPLIELTVEAGLYANFHKDDATELKVQVVSLQSMPAKLIIDDKNGIDIRDLRLNEHQHTTFWIGAKPKDDGSVTVTLSPEQGESITRTLLLTSIDKPITLVASTLVHKQHDEELVDEKVASTILLLSVQRFPHTQMGYAPVRSIILDLQTLSGLDAQQSRALGGYIATCGLLLLDNPPALLLERLAEQAGCKGHFVKGFEKLSATPALLRTLQAQHPPALPDQSELQRLVTPPQYLPVFIFLSGYLLLILASVMLAKQSLFLLSIPLLTACAGLVAWSGAGEQQLVLWAETTSGDSQARYTAVLRTGGDRRGMLEIGLADTTQLLAGNASAISSIKHILDDGQYRITAHTALFSPALYLLGGVIRQDHTISLSLTDNGPKVVNLGRITSPPGNLLWRNQCYRIPPLLPKERWLPGDSDQGVETPPQQLLYPLPFESTWIAPTTAEQKTGLYGCGAALSFTV